MVMYNPGILVITIISAVILVQFLKPNVTPLQLRLFLILTRKQFPQRRAYTAIEHNFFIMFYTSDNHMQQIELES